LNVGKRQEVQLSLLNDEDLRNYAALMISEPHAWPTEEGELVTVPRYHANWEKMIPLTRKPERWQIRSMLWIRKDITAEQVPVDSSDITAALLSLPGREILLLSVYIPCQDTDALEEAANHIRQATQSVQQRRGPVEVILAGDFNRHDTLWGGDGVCPYRQGEAEPLIELAEELRLQSLLPKGTVTWQVGDRESTIDLIFVTERLAEEYQHCRVHRTEHRSDHRAIDTLFDIEAQRREQIEPRLLFKNTPWTEISDRVANELQGSPRPQDTQAQTDRLLNIVATAVKALTPTARPSPYAKRWWTQDLTRLRREYTNLHNRARAQRRGGRLNEALEAEAREAAREYHRTLRRQKKGHWEEFLAEESNI
jgi:endonuclease/exonuclease/phosphatase family metal-dependent hydrolase